MRPSTSEASAASLPPRLLRLLLAGATVARRESHPLKTDAFHGARDSIQIVLPATCFPSPIAGGNKGVRTKGRTKGSGTFYGRWRGSASCRVRRHACGPFRKHVSAYGRGIVAAGEVRGKSIESASAFFRGEDDVVLQTRMGHCSLPIAPSGLVFLGTRFRGFPSVTPGYAPSALRA